MRRINIRTCYQTFQTKQWCCSLLFQVDHPTSCTNPNHYQKHAHHASYRTKHAKRLNKESAKAIEPGSGSVSVTVSGRVEAATGTRATPPETRPAPFCVVNCMNNYRLQEGPLGDDRESFSDGRLRYMAARALVERTMAPDTRNASIFFGEDRRFKLPETRSS